MTKECRISKSEYSRVHNLLRKNNGPAARCENPFCISLSPKRFEWALIKGRKYSSNAEDYIQLCPSCHRKYDETAERRAKLSKIHAGKHYHGRDRKVVRIKDDDRVLFDTITIAAQKTGILHTSLVNCLSGRSKTAGGYSWEYQN